MFDSVKDISLRTIVLVAVVVWAILAALWFVTLGWDHTIATQSTAAAVRGPGQALARNPAPEIQGQGPGSTNPADSPPEIVIQSGNSKVESQRPSGSRTPAPPAQSQGDLVLQLGAFKGKQSAEERAAAIQAKGIRCQVRPPSSADDYYRVLAGPYASRSEALSDQVRLKEEEIDSFLRKTF
jgi:cell division protein FtsN